MVDDLTRRRSEEVRVKLAPALAAEFSAIAAGKGLLPATLAAVALGEYCERHRQQLSMQRMVALDTSKRMSDVVMDADVLAKAIAQVMADPATVAIFTQQPQAGAQA